MKQYKELLQHVLDNGVVRKDRTGTGTLSVFGYQNRYNLEDGFPLVTTKRVSFHDIKHELQWFLNGDTNIKYLNDNKVKIWDAWCTDGGNLGSIYGKQWRDFDGVDQIDEVIDSIIKYPESRRHIVTAWNPSDVNDMALPPCHCLFQFYVARGKLSCQLYQRSADVFLGVPFNIASYALLTIMIAQVVDLLPGEFVHTLGDAHIYKNHIPQAELQLERLPKKLPQMTLDDEVRDIFGFCYESFDIKDYNPDAHIAAKVAV